MDAKLETGACAAPVTPPTSHFMCAVAAHSVSLPLYWWCWWCPLVNSIWLFLMVHECEGSRRSLYRCPLALAWQSNHRRSFAPFLHLNTLTPNAFCKYGQGMVHQRSTRLSISTTKDVLYKISRVSRRLGG